MMKPFYDISEIPVLLQPCSTYGEKKQPKHTEKDSEKKQKDRKKVEWRKMAYQ